ncbi:MAG: ABC transporter substrate-binding protein [Micrococcaceae bacterium]
MMQRTVTRRTVLLGGLGLGAAGVLLGCGEGSPSGPSAAPTGTEAAPSAGGVEEVGVLPIVDVATIFIAQTHGIFADHGLDIETTLAQGGSAIVPAVVSGANLFGFSNLTSLLIGRSRGLDLVTVAPGSGSNGQVDEDYFAVLVRDDSDTQDGAGLSGASIAVNTVQNINDTTLNAAVRDAGGDPSDIDYMEVAFPDMPAALENGQVDAIAVGEPFLTIAKDQGARVVLSSYARPIDRLTVSAYFTTQEAWDAQPERVTAFQSAMAEAQTIARNEPESVRAVLPEYTGLDAELAERIILPDFPERINQESTQQLADLAEADGLLQASLQVTDLLGEGSY